MCRILIFVVPLLRGADKTGGGKGPSESKSPPPRSSHFVSPSIAACHLQQCYYYLAHPTFSSLLPSQPRFSFPLHMPPRAAGMANAQTKMNGPRRLKESHHRHIPSRGDIISLCVCVCVYARDRDYSPIHVRTHADLPSLEPILSRGAYPACTPNVINHRVESVRPQRVNLMLLK